MLVNAAVLAACTARPVAAPKTAALDTADAMVLRGCYACLLDARAEYRQHAARRADVAARIFETDLLLALREKELGLPPSDALPEARRLAGALPAHLEVRHYLALVEAVPTEQLAIPRRATQAFSTAHAALAARIHAEQHWLTTGHLRSPVREYLKMSLACAYPDPDSPPSTPPLEPPLLAYRARICDLTNAGDVAVVRAREPRFVETAFFIANTELAAFATAGARELPGHLAELLARFPASAAVTYVAASHARLIGDCPRALTLYDRLLVAQPEHEQALLGRAICLSYLAQPHQAITAATRLIELAPDEVAEAYYWRAWNHHVLHQLVQARADITEAKQRLDEPYVSTLAGVIAYELRDLDAAQADLEAAAAGAPTDCVARSYLAAVERARERWSIAGRAYEAAIRCYTTRAAASVAKLAAVQSTTGGDAAHRDRELARLRDEAARDTGQARRAALAGAASHAAAGSLADARALLGLASEDPAQADAIAKLRARLDASVARRRR